MKMPRKVRKLSVKIIPFRRNRLPLLIPCEMSILRKLLKMVDISTIILIAALEVTYLPQKRTRKLPIKPITWWPISCKAAPSAFC